MNLHRPAVACLTCGVSFLPAAAHHRICTTCWRWSLARRLALVTAQLLREARP